LSQNPRKILEPYVEEGMNVLDIGSAMGFFSLPLARMVGANGRVICVDIQERMMRSLEKRARKAGLSERIETRVCSQDSLDLGDLDGQIDLALAFAVVHEVPDASRFFSETHAAIKPSGRLLLAEPTGHVSEASFVETVAAAERSGFSVVETPKIKRSRTVLLGKKENYRWP
jgi:2-polyprenyl-3-methyl-5-hydroxy-6-metoxy-1,4-benzoquinol methylase